MLWQPETNVETLSSDKSWKFKEKLKAAVNLSLLHIHFSQGLLYVVLAYMTPHSAIQASSIQAERSFYIYRPTSKALDAVHWGWGRSSILCFYQESLIAQILSDQRAFPLAQFSGFYCLFPGPSGSETKY